VEDREKILESLRKNPRDAGELSQVCGIARNAMFALLMKMEKENLIEWTGRAWTTSPSPEATPGGDADTRPPSTGSSGA
jgi:predicted transcriptional regulator